MKDYETVRPCDKPEVKITNHASPGQEHTNAKEQHFPKRLWARALLLAKDLQGVRVKLWEPGYMQSTRAGEHKQSYGYKLISPERITYHNTCKGLIESLEWLKNQRDIRQDVDGGKEDG